MATPHVTGIAALLAAHEPALGPAEIKQRIIATAQPVPSLLGKVAASGRANAYNALANLPRVDPTAAVDSACRKREA